MYCDLYKSLIKLNIEFNKALICMQELDESVSADRFIIHSDLINIRLGKVCRN